MKISEAFFQILKSPIWIFVGILLVGFIIYGHITLPLKVTFHGIFFLLIAFFLAIIIFSTIVNLAHFIEFQAIRDFQNQLQQFKLRIKFLLFCFSFEGEYENKKIEINLLPIPAFPTPNFLIIYRLYSPFPFKAIIKKDFLKTKNQIKTDNPERVKSYLERKEIREVAEKLINTFGKIEISYQWVQLSEVTPFNLFMFLFKTRLAPARVRDIIEKLKILTKS
jgi:hypothetical protein